MKIKNLNIQKTAIPKLTSCVLIGTMTAVALTGCARVNILKGTILENTCVVTFEDGTKDIAVSLKECDKSKFHHYYSVTSGYYFSDEACEKTSIEFTASYHYKITNEESITNYLTPEELAKATKDGFNATDIANIITRVFEPTIEEANNMTR